MLSLNSWVKKKKFSFSNAFHLGVGGPDEKIDFAEKMQGIK